MSPKYKERVIPSIEGAEYVSTDFINEIRGMFLSSGGCSMEGKRRTRV